MMKSEGSEPESFEGDEFIKYALQQDFCVPAQKVENVMRQCLNNCFNKKLLLRKRTRLDSKLTDFSDFEID